MKKTFAKLVNTVETWGPTMVWLWAVETISMCGWYMAHGIEPAYMAAWWPEVLGSPYYASIVMACVVLVLERVFRPFKKEES